VTNDERTRLKSAWKEVDNQVILHLARMVKAGFTPAQILAEAVEMKTGKGTNAG